MVVVDTSVVFKWFVPEPDSERALQLRAAHAAGLVSLATVDLCLIELANALRFRRPTPTAGEIDRAIQSFLELDVRVVATTPPLIASAAALALDRGLTVYDAVFVALAADLGYELVTADEDLVSRAGPVAAIRHLREWNLPGR